MERQPDTQYILSLSYGKDSLACLEAIKLLGMPLDRIVHAEVWATDTIQADFPDMVEFKKKADKIILDRYGIKVEHVYATRTVEREREKLTYEKVFYRTYYSKKYECECIYGFPCIKGPWCNSKLKVAAIDSISKSVGTSNVVQYIGITADEPERIERYSKTGFMLPLVMLGWDENYCRNWCEENDLLSPIYQSALRGGCWFCHNQGVDQLRLLRRNHPNLWQLLLKWDLDSPVTFKPKGLTVHDFEKRFTYEDEGKIPIDHRFKWKMVEELDKLAENN